MRIVREEMDAAGALELLMPALCSRSSSGRSRAAYETMGELLMQLTIGGDHHVALGPTHEEVVTDLVRDLIRSYKQLPITLYQIQTKFRDEPRPRFGILRTREFLMKDAYSFDADLDQLNASYDAMYEAYCRIFDRCGLPYVVVEAESGPIGGDSLARVHGPLRHRRGHRSSSARPATTPPTQERAEIGASRRPPSATADVPAASTRSRPRNRRTIEEVCDFLKVDEDQTAKLLVFLADGKPVAALIRGDHEANEAKVRRAFGATSIVARPTPTTIEKATGAPMGFLGPVDIKIPLVVDQAVAAMPTVVVGGNEVDVHLTGSSPAATSRSTGSLDLRNADEGDPCPRCGQPLDVEPGDRDRPRLQARHEVLEGDGGERSSTTRGTSTRSSWAATGSA